MKQPSLASSAHKKVQTAIEQVNAIPCDGFVDKLPPSERHTQRLAIAAIAHTLRSRGFQAPSAIGANCLHFSTKTVKISTQCRDLLVCIGQALSLLDGAKLTQL
mmetsp:Transcript_52962/g.141547  ORF Transcript_52962/g.141547 Transcript_52962/m.141547 type:complete len:104 (-) Transcript_52962:492-803(-)